MNGKSGQRISQQQLESYLWGAATLLRGTIDAGDYKQFIFPLLFYKRLCDVFDEERDTAVAELGKDFPENHRFQIPRDAHWNTVREVTTNVGTALQNAMRSIEKANQDKLYGIFGDAQWTNKDRLSDAMLRDLIEHFSSLDLTIANLPEDELGNGYEYLIKKFADDSGHTAAEFYTNRTVVHLMTELLQPQPGESIYDPTCGSGGMLLSAIAHLKNKGKEWRNVKLYGQELNLMTSSIARMNCFLHGIEDFRIERGDTLSNPKFIENGELQKFDVILANPPYSIKQWDRGAFETDSWGRNMWGTPPQGRADYAFQQHIIRSLNETGRCAILWPHGVLFRQEEAEMRRRMIEADIVECVIGLGPNLFYNSPMEACILVCNMRKPETRRGKVLFIDAVDEVTRERAASYLTSDHIDRIVRAYRGQPGEKARAGLIASGRILDAGGTLSIPLHLPKISKAGMTSDLDSAFDAWSNALSALADDLVTLGVAPAPAAPRGRVQVPKWLDRAKWTREKFGNFAVNVTERVEPKDEPLAVYVGLEHIDPGDLRIARHGYGSDVSGTKLRFKTGDIIFGRRRAYQRKLAVAEVAGICSAHAMVVRAKPEFVLPEFLPWFMFSDAFMQRAVEISVGSLSPTINWKNLRIAEFEIPPLDQQRRSANVLWEMDRYRAKAQSLRASIRRWLLAHAANTEKAADGPANWVTLKDIARVIDCKHRTPKIVENGIPMVSPGTVGWGPLRFDKCNYTTEEEALSMMDHCEPRRWDLVMGRNQKFGEPAYVSSSQRFVLGQDTVLIQSNSQEGRFIYGAFHMPAVRRQLVNLSVGSTFKRVNLNAIRSLQIPWPDPAIRTHFEHLVESYEVSMLKLPVLEESIDRLRERFVETLLGASS